MGIVLSCEHAGCDVPEGYQYLFAADPDVLRTHRSYDIGIEPLARRVAGLLDVPLLACRTSRLLIEPNRSLHHPKLFSEFSRSLRPEERDRLIDCIWRPHRQAVTEAVARHVHRGCPVLHLALHSFAPVMDGTRRKADLGLLYDPRRSKESRVARILQEELRRTAGWRVRRNYPYEGRADGLTSALRRTFRPDDYLGLEIEWNQSLLAGPATDAEALARPFCEALRSIR